MVLTITYMYLHIIIGMDDHIQQVPLHCRVCGQRLTKYRSKQTNSYECKAFLSDLQIALKRWHFCGWCQHTSWTVLHALWAFHGEIYQCHHEGGTSQVYSDPIWVAETWWSIMQGTLYRCALCKHMTWCTGMWALQCLCKWTQQEVNSWQRSSGRHDT